MHRHKEVKFEHDLKVLVTHFTSKKVHIKTPDRIVEAASVASRQSIAKGNSKTHGGSAVPRKPAAPKFVIPGDRETKSAVSDVIEIGAAVLHSGKFDEFIQSTVVDPKFGYASKAGGFSGLDGSMAENSGEIDDSEGDLSAQPGIGGLGGGEFD